MIETTTLLATILVGFPTLIVVSQSLVAKLAKVGKVAYIAPEVGDFETWKYTRGHVILKETR